MATARQKIVAQLVAKGSTVSNAMRKAGYSETTAQHSNKVTRTKGFQELMEKYLPDKMLMEKHQEMLNVPRIKRVFIKGDLQTEIEEFDSQAVGKGLDMAYKLKGSYAVEKHGITIPKPLMDVD